MSAIAIQDVYTVTTNLIQARYSLRPNILIGKGFYCALAYLICLRTAVSQKLQLDALKNPLLGGVWVGYSL